MMPLRVERRMRWMRTFGVVVLAVLALGSAGHFWHHLTDDCESSSQGFPHPCAQCGGLHAGVLAEGIQTAAAPRLADLALVDVACDANRAVQTRGAGSPRAPPLS